MYRSVIKGRIRWDVGGLELFRGFRLGLCEKEV